MGNLINFIIKYGAGILFILLQILCIILIYNYNPYQRNILFHTHQRIAGTVYDIRNNITGYFYLRTENKTLLLKNAQLEAQLLQLTSEQRRINNLALILGEDTTKIFQHHDEIFAEVINNSFSGMNNYITLDKGSKDGIKADMGVVNQGGIVGIVSNVSDNYSVVISLLNSKLRISCKVKGDEAIGSLSWDGKDPRYARLEELPRHVSFAIGDTIVTSGYSAIFPEGIIVGIIENAAEEKKDFNTVIVKLSTDFHRLRYVRVVGNSSRDEQINLEKEARKND